MAPRSSAARTEEVRVRNERGVRRRVTGAIRRCHGFRSISDQSSLRRKCTSGALAGLVEVLELGLDPRADVVLAHVSLDRVQTLAALAGCHRDRLVNRLGL